MSARSCRLTRFRVTAEPTARLTTNPTLAGSRRCSASSRASKWPTTRGLPARVPVRTVSANSAPLRIRDEGGRIRHSAGRGPCACGRRGRRARPGCACAAGNHASSRGADCSAGTCAYSLGLQVRILTVLLQGSRHSDPRPGSAATLPVLPDAHPAHAPLRRAALGFTPGYHLEHRRLPGVSRCRVLGCGKLCSPDGAVTLRSGDATCTTCG